MITYPVIFFGAGNGPLKEDFNDYPVGEVVNHDQVWQHYCNQWLVPKNPTKYVGVVWKDYGVSGAFDDFSLYSNGRYSISNTLDLLGQGNFDHRPHKGFSVGYYRESKGGFVSSDTVQGADYINFDWGAEPPVEGFKHDFWSAKFVGKLNLPIDGTYRFYVERNDSCRIYVGRENGPNLLVFDKWGDAPNGTLEAGYGFTFSAGLIDVLIHFYDDASDAKLRLYWSKPTISGGAPETPPIVILPSDFGDKGYFRVYTKTLQTSSASQSFDFDGSYWYGIPFGELSYQDNSASFLDVSGSYRLGRLYNDIVSDISQSRISSAGYYVSRGLGVRAPDFAKNTIQGNGFYSYHSATVNSESDTASVVISPRNSFYAYRSPVSFDRHSAKKTLTSAGFYGIGNVRIDDGTDSSLVSIDANGFHALRYAHGNATDSAQFVADIYGNYFPIRVYTSENDYAQNLLRHSGYYISGYVNDDNIDYSRNSIGHAGYRAYWMVTGDKILESTFARNSLGISHGNYFYRNVSLYTQEDVFGSFDTRGIYSSRYSYTINSDDCSSTLNSQGNYYNIYAYTRPVEHASNKINPAGYFKYGYCSSYANEISRSFVRAAGHYVSGYTQADYTDVEFNRINSNGNYFFGVNFVQGRDLSKNLLQSLGQYFSIRSLNRYADLLSSSVSYNGNYYWRYVNSHGGRDLARENMFVNGEYAIRFFPYKFGTDFAAENIDHRGHYITGRVNQRSLDISRNSLNSAGNYFNRFSSSPSVDIARASQFVDGSYLYRILTSENSSVDISRTQLGYAGRYYQLRVPSSQVDASEARLNLQGLYFDRYPKHQYVEPAKFDITFGGEVLSRFAPRQDTDSILEEIGFSEAFYTSRFVPADISTMNAKSFLLFDGEYSRESWILADSTVFEIDFASELTSFCEKGDYATTSTDISGSFVAKKVSTTMDYWLEIYKNPTYNMGKTQAYFSI